MIRIGQVNLLNYRIKGDKILRGNLGDSRQKLLAAEFGIPLNR